MEREEMIDFILNKVKEEKGHIGIPRVITFGSNNITISDISIYEKGQMKYMIGNHQTEDPSNVRGIRTEILEKICSAINENKYL